MSETAQTESKASPWRQALLWTIGAVALLAVIFFGAKALLVDRNGPLRLVVYAFSTQQEVLTEAIFPAFEAAWEAETGRSLTIEGAFGASATLAGQINLGAPADVALFSNEQDVTRIKAGGQADRDAQGVVFSYTPMAIVTRPGNPFGLAAWSDLAQPGLRVLHPDPRTSGAGAWGVLAQYGSALLQSGSTAAAQELLQAVWGNVQAMSPSARDALVLFELGAGDAHWRPVAPDDGDLPPLVQPFTVQDLGGWSRAYAEVIDGVWQKQIQPQLEVETIGPQSTRSP